MKPVDAPPPLRTPLPNPVPTTAAPEPSRLQRASARAKLTDRLLYTWERLRPAQRDAAWEMVETMRTTMASERRSRRAITLLVGVALVASGVLAYLLLTAPPH